jgi:putative membrane protein
MSEAEKAPKTANELAEDRTTLAVQRTVMAADRSLMAWIRTGLSMTSFGFTIYKLLQGFQASGEILPRDGTPRNIGLFLTGLGALSLLAGTVEYRRTLKDLNSEHALKAWRPALIMAVLLGAVSFFMFVAIFVKVL